jgi:hypothetical protein
LDTPRGDFIEISSSSYDLLLFSSKASSDHDRGVGAAPRGASNMSVGDVWPEIDSSHDTDCEASFATAMRNHLEASTSCPLLGARGSKKRKIN